MYSPDLLDDIIIRQHSADVLRNQRHDFVFNLRQVYIPPFHHHKAAVEVNLKLPRLKSARGHVGNLRTHAVAQRRADAGQKLRSAKRLGDVIIRPKIQRLHLFLFPPARGHNDNRHFRPLPHGFEHIQPVNVRQAEVEQDHIRPV